MRTIQIVVADDEAIQRKNMALMIETACQKLHIKPIITCHESAESFLFDLEDHQEWQIAFLDIEMAEINGMELAHQLKTKSSLFKNCLCHGLCGICCGRLPSRCLRFSFKAH
ncbi:response regulator [Facklamia miroungae]|uniref:Response regulator receiver domain-containing protein n=1 Tax=Facklamia miroungae TaxID=120956 RepID=A0A1G7UVW3_9LACT|nr:response regulator [Facklamia miroungae]NKZ30142.1 response regulator [Facklamia miroungae]SDG51637.1 Response regulator receiver domain-containing protein [Facklamia miroungae]